MYTSLVDNSARTVDSCNEGADTFLFRSSVWKAVDTFEISLIILHWNGYCIESRNMVNSLIFTEAKLKSR